MLVLMLAMTGACHMYDEGDGDANAERLRNKRKADRAAGEAIARGGGRRHEGEAKGEGVTTRRFGNVFRWRSCATAKTCSNWAALLAKATAALPSGQAGALHNIQVAAQLYHCDALSGLGYAWRK